MKVAGAALALALAGGGALAQGAPELAPDSVPVPEARPEDEAAGVEQDLPRLIPPGGAEPAPEAEPGEGASPVASGEPEFAGEDAPEAEPGGEPEAAAQPAEEPAGPPLREVLAETEAELSSCLAELDRLGVGYERAEPILDPGLPDCGIANPVMVTEVAPGVALEPPVTLRCEAALAAARWVADVALPLSAKLEGRGPLAAIDQGTSYLCRPRADGELSEHAFGNALDVMGFRFESGEPIPVQPRAGEGTLEEAFQRAVRAGACLDFTTVLGPGSDADHADHLHLDVSARDGGFRICE
jgi:hypothetical protein